MRSGLLWVVCGVVAAVASLAARVLWQRRLTNEVRLEALVTTYPILLGGLLGVAATGPVDRRTAGVLLGGALLALPWVWRPNGKASVKRPLAIAAALAVALVAGVRIEFFKHPVLQVPVETGAAMIPLTAAWLALTTIAFHTTKRLEGMSLPLLSVAATAFTLVILVQRQDLTLARGLGVGVSGAATGLALLALFGVRPPARDGTAATAGFLVGSAAVVGMSKTSAVLGLVLPLLILAIPALSMTTLVLDRIRRRVVVTEVRQDFYGLLLNRGLPKHKVIILVTAIEAYLAVVTVLLAILRTLAPPAKVILFIAATAAAAPLFSRFLRLMLRSPGSGPGAPAAHLLDMRLDAIGMRDAVQRIEQFIASREPHHIVTGDTLALGRSLEDPAFRDVINAAHMVTADGIGVVWAARLFGVPINERISGIDLMEALFARARETHYTFFLLGGRPGVAEEAARNISARHPGVTVVGMQHGYFTADEESAVVNEIRAAGPDVLFVALGSPRQDHWIRRHIAELGVPVCIGVGGSLDVLAGKLRRAPRWMQQMGLEWIYRAIQEPWRAQRWSRFPRVISESLKRKILSYWS